MSTNFTFSASAMSGSASGGFGFAIEGHTLVDAASFIRSARATASSRAEAAASAAGIFRQTRLGRVTPSAIHRIVVVGLS
jgi:hypothetical protein